jgi:CRP-like cAMP-binding protein
MPNTTNQAAFDPKTFLAIVGEGKTILEFRKDQIVFAQGDAADTVFYIQKGRVKVIVISEQGKEAVVGILGSGQFFGEGCMKRSFAAHCDHDRDGRLSGHRYHEDGDARCTSRTTEVFRDVHGVFADPQQPY